MGTEVIVNGRFLSRRMTGVERYGREILGRLGGRVRVIRAWRDVQGAAGHLWEQVILPRHISSRSVLWSPANTGPLIVSNQVLTLHDLSPLEHPEWFKRSFSVWYRLFLPVLARRAKRVLTDSDHIRQKVLERFALPAERVIAVPCGVDPAHFYPQEDPPGLGRYILFVGSLEPRKNLTALLSAWKGIKDDHQDVTLIVAGDTGPVFRKYMPPANPDRVQFIGYVPERELPALYAGALVFVLPSLDEGFGLTALEAMACGIPVLASNAGSLPEVVGDAGLLFDPNNPAALAERLDRCLGDFSLRQSLREKGLERAQHYSWTSAAEQIWQILCADHGA